MTSPRINNTAILLALGDWERHSMAPPTDHDTLVRLGGACLRVGLPLVKAAEGRRSVEVERLCASAVFAHSNRALTQSSSPGPSSSSYVADVVTLGLASYSVVSLCKAIGPSMAEVPPRSWRQKAQRVANWLRSADRRRRVARPEIPSQELESEIQTTHSFPRMMPPAMEKIASFALPRNPKTSDQFCHPSLPNVEGSACTKRKLSPSGDNSHPPKRPKTERSPPLQKKKEVEGVETKDVDEGEKKEVEGGEEKEIEGGKEEEVECREKSATSCGNASLLEEETLLEGPTRQNLVRGKSQEALKSAGPAV